MISSPNYQIIQNDNNNNNLVKVAEKEVNTNRPN